MATTEKRLSVTLDATTRAWVQHRAQAEDRSESYIVAKILAAAREESALSESPQAPYQAGPGVTTPRKGAKPQVNVSQFKLDAERARRLLGKVNAHPTS